MLNVVRIEFQLTAAQYTLSKLCLPATLYAGTEHINRQFEKYLIVHVYFRSLIVHAPYSIDAIDLINFLHMSMF